MTRPALDTRHRLDQAEGPALSSLRPWVESMARRVSIAVMGLAAFGCVVTETERDKRFWLVALPFSLVAVVVFLLCTES